MFVSHDRKTYDTADGSEQPYDARTTTPRERRETRTARQQWADDGGAPAPADGCVPAGAAPALTGDPVAEPLGPGEFATKPAWSTQSLRDLNAAIRWENSEPARHKRDAEQAERERAIAIQAHEDRIEAAFVAWRDRYRNAWDNT